MTARRHTVRRWPLALIAAPAAVAVWSGWVGLGELAGFGIVHPLPGIVPGFQLNTAICLPVGIESYGAYALGAWLSPGTPEAAQRFAKRSALGALLLGMLGQVCYHLLAARHATAAPAPVVVLVSCLPVAVLGLAAALTHLLRVPEALDSAAEPAHGHPAAEHAQEPVPVVLPEHDQLAQMFRTELENGTIPGVRQVKREARCGTPRAQEIQQHLAGVLARQSSNGHRELVS